MINKEIEIKINKFINDFQVTYDDIKGIDNKISELNNELAIKEAEQDDLLHEIELANLNVVGRSRIYNSLKQVREERRLIKDELIVCKTIKPLADILAKKGLYPEIKQSIQNLETCRSNIKDRKYNPKVRKDLKCAKEDS